MAGLNPNVPFYSRWTAEEWVQWFKDDPVSCARAWEEEWNQWSQAQALLRPGEPNPYAYEGGEDSSRYRADLQAFAMRPPPEPTLRQQHAARYLLNTGNRELQGNLALQQRFQHEMACAELRGDYGAAALYRKRISYLSRDVTPEMFADPDEEAGKGDARGEIKDALETFARAPKETLEKISPHWREDMAFLADRLNALSPDAESSFIVDKSGQVQEVQHPGRTVSDYLYAVEAHNLSGESEHEKFRLALAKEGHIPADSDYSSADPTLEDSARCDDGEWESEPTGEMSNSFQESVSCNPEFSTSRSTSIEPPPEAGPRFSESVSSKGGF